MWHIIDFIIADGAEWLHQSNCTQEETDALARDVQTSDHRICGTTSKPPRADDVKMAWEEITRTARIFIFDGTVQKIKHKGIMEQKLHQ